MRFAWLPLIALSACFYVTQADREARFDLDQDKVPRPTDCDDDDKKVGEIFWYADLDGDGFGDEGNAVSACEQPEGYIVDGTDCDDESDLVHPGATELCNGVDDDCDGVADPPEQVVVPTWWKDGDGDGFGDPEDTLQACDQPADYVVAGTAADADCDDTDMLVKPGGTEVACNDADDDCDGQVDLDDDDIDLADWAWAWDGDGDGWGCADDTECSGLGDYSAHPPVVACDQPNGYAAVDPDHHDCDDTDPAVHPYAVEVCNGADDDCDTVTDPDGSVGAQPYFEDGDGDGFGGANRRDACTDPGAGWLAMGPPDCDDADGCSFPGAIEYCNGADNDCDLDVDDQASGGCTTPPAPGECPNP